jgi:hypothetical protein
MAVSRENSFAKKNWKSEIMLDCKKLKKQKQGALKWSQIRRRIEPCMREWEMILHCEMNFS